MGMLIVAVGFYIMFSTTIFLMTCMMIVMEERQFKQSGETGLESIVFLYALCLAWLPIALYDGYHWLLTPR